jgi:ribosomal-protein-alanine N-acetyltransferase
VFTDHPKIYLETERLVLRGWAADDLEPFAALNADPRVMEHFPQTLSRAQSDEYAGHFQHAIGANGFGYFALAMKFDHRFIGYVGISKVIFDAEFTPAIEIAWRLGFEFWGKGLATEAAKASLAFGFSVLELEEILSFTTPENACSIAVMNRLGLTRDVDGDFEHPRVPVGHRLRRHVLYRLQNPRGTSHGFE